MKSHSWWGFLFFALAALTWFNHNTRAEPETRSRQAADAMSDTAVLDVGRAIKNHPRFRREMADLKRAAGIQQTAFRTKLTKMAADETKLNNLAKGSAQHSALRRKIATARLNYKQDLAEMKDGLLKREAYLYADIYENLLQEVGELAAKKEIRLVIRIHREKLNRDDREGVLRQINKAVVYEEGLDITDEIIRIIAAKEKDRGPEKG